MMPIHFDVIRDGNQFSSRADGGSKFTIGSLARYHGNLGLANDNFPLGRQFLYKASDHRANFGFWADFIEPTAICEGQSFLTLNTYDRARFTYGFAQFAAHVPNGDFVIWFREMLTQPDVNDYFPDLGLQNGRIVKHSVTGTTALEDDQSTEPLMNYLNPTLAAIEDDEVIAAAKFIHWTMNHPPTQTLQVKQMVATGRRLLTHADRRLGLNGVTGDLCCIIMDILHQGRGGAATFPDMLHALKSSNPYNSLLAIGAMNEPVRVKTLKKELDARRGAFQQMIWNSAQTDFVQALQRAVG